tara:strand:+ start:771 stop:1016 length:246 start_codon:yes stop_codon:yes gene_type:complete
MTQVLVNGELVTLSDEEEKTRLEEAEKNKEERAKIKYARDRGYAYPHIQEQLDMIYWDRKNSTKKWEEAIDKVKADNPKPE